MNETKIEHDKIMDHCISTKIVGSYRGEKSYALANANNI
uniref:Uncharacterized protein n=1 Tax=Onchocerca volvulus TaxID=6282 RepID=A0A8R1XYH1_ONCVO